MANETLTITFQNAAYIDGFIFITITTAEECVIDLLYTSTKPTRKRDPNIQEPGMKPHRWIYFMRYVHRINSLFPLPATQHQFSFRFPELSDCLYFTALYKDLPDPVSPQSPIFAWRVPLTPVYIESWDALSIASDWLVTDNPPESTITTTPGRIALANEEAPFSDSQLGLDTTGKLAHIGGDSISYFVLYDSIYNPINQDIASYYILEFYFKNPVFPTIKKTLIYGDLNDSPCNLFPPGFLGNFQPHVPHLFCTDLYRIPTEDLCGNIIGPGTLSNFLFFNVGLTNISLTPAGQIARVIIRPFCIYRMSGPLQDISNRWRYIRPVLPQVHSPKFSQPK